MPLFASLIALPLLLSGASDPARLIGSRLVSVEQRIELAQLSIEQRVIIRIPNMPGRTAGVLSDAPPVAIRWKESKGPRCVPLGVIRAAAATKEGGVTMVVNRRERYRAHLNRACRTADFYAGFYITPNKDGVLCAERDVIHARNGSVCEIEKFGRLTPED